MRSKSEVAFRWSCERLFETEERVYFWTFTFTRVMPDWCYSGVWFRFIKEVCDLYGGLLRGVKVVELHQTRGIHYHALLNRRVWVGEVRRIGKRYGIGRVHVVAADPGAVDYLAKYLSKGHRDENKLHAKCARWGTVGRFKGVRVKDIEVKSSFHDAIKEVQCAFGQRQIPFVVVDLLRRYSNDPEGLARLVKLVVREESIRKLAGRRVRPDWQGRNYRPATSEVVEEPQDVQPVQPAREVRRSWVSWIEASMGGDQ